MNEPRLGKRSFAPFGMAGGPGEPATRTPNGWFIEWAWPVPRPSTALLGIHLFRW
jgi:hypothetical protein